jgi:hypothetical protein
VADVTVLYTLTTPGGTVLFNDDAVDEYYLSNIAGLDGAPIRAPVDNAPQTDGGLVHDFFLGPRHVTMEGILFIRSSRVGDEIRDQRNVMEQTLREALESALRADATLAWTPAGGDPHLLTVRYEVPVEFTYTDNFLTKSFAFGLVAADPTMLV